MERGTESSSGPKNQGSSWNFVLCTKFFYNSISFVHCTECVNGSVARFARKFLWKFPTLVGQTTDAVQPGKKKVSRLTYTKTFVRRRTVYHLHHTMFHRIDIRVRILHHSHTFPRLDMLRLRLQEPHVVLRDVRHLHLHRLLGHPPLARDDDGFISPVCLIWNRIPAGFHKIWPEVSPINCAVIV